MIIYVLIILDKSDSRLYLSLIGIDIDINIRGHGIELNDKILISTIEFEFYE